MGKNESVLDVLNQVVYNSLRKVDVSTKYSSCPTIVLLVDLNTRNGDIVTWRVIHIF